MERYGFTYGVMVEIAPWTPEPSRRVLLDRRQSGWERVYSEHMHHLADPVVSEILRSPDPFFWGDLPLRRGRLTTAERRVLRHAERFGLREGFVASRRGTNGAIEGLILAGPNLMESPADAKTSLCDLANIVFSQYPIVTNPRFPTRSSVRALRSRQIECLHWAAHGKTSTEIGLILSLSRKTVDEHIENACRTFGVNGRIQAVARAIHIGLIDLR